MLSSELFVDYIVNPEHIVLLIIFGYGSYLFYRDYLNGENGVTLAIALVLGALAVGEMWSITFLWFIDNVDLARYARGVQLGLVILAILNLVHQYLCYQRNRENDKLQSENNRQYKKGC